MSGSLVDRLRAILSPSSRADERNIDSLAVKLGASRDDAEWVYRRSHEVGFGAAMLEWDELCRKRAEGR